MSWSHTGVHSAATDTHTGKEQVREKEGRKQRSKPTTRLPQQHQDSILVSGSAMCCDCVLMGEEMSNRADFVFTMIQKRK